MSGCGCQDPVVFGHAWICLTGYLDEFQLFDAAMARQEAHMRAAIMHARMGMMIIKPAAAFVVTGI